MNYQTAATKLTRAICYNNGKIATTQLEQIMLSMIEPSKRALWSKIIKIALQAPEYADQMFALRKVDNNYHQILALCNINTHEVIWQLK